MEEAFCGERLASLHEAEVRLYARLVGANRLRLRDSINERRTQPGGLGRGEGHPARGAPARSVGTGLDALPLGDREALLLVVLGRLDYATVAEILGISATVLVTRLVHARDTLGSGLWTTGRPAANGASPVPRSPGGHLRLVKS